MKTIEIESIGKMSSLDLSYKVRKVLVRLS
jgi:hypothetical protein